MRGRSTVVDTISTSPSVVLEEERLSTVQNYWMLKPLKLTRHYDDGGVVVNGDFLHSNNHSVTKKMFQCLLHFHSRSMRTLPTPESLRYVENGAAE
jgi:hypothetical protein